MSSLIRQSHATNDSPLWLSASGGTINGALNVKGTISTSPDGQFGVISGGFFVKDTGGATDLGIGYDSTVNGNGFIFCRPGKSIILAQTGSITGNSAFTPSADGVDLDSLSIGGTVFGNVVSTSSLTLDSSTPGKAICGTSTLVAGQSPVITTTACLDPTTKIFLQRTDVNASTSLGELRIKQRNAGNFLVESDAIATPGVPDAGDVSTFDWMIVNVF
jgi:hypothetical protein